MNDVEAEYKYLRPSIERFPTGPELVDLALGAGFEEANDSNFNRRVNGVFSLPGLALKNCIFIIPTPCVWYWFVLNTCVLL